MKILFVTGGAECDCGGDGFVEKVVGRIPIRLLCHCVEVHEAIIEDTTQYEDDPQPLRVIPE